MKRLRKIIAPLILVCLLGCSSSPLNTVTQVSTIDAILAGAYDGQMTCGGLLSNGDFGIGTFHALDGEMVIIDGEIYQVKADGKVYSPRKDAMTPFAAVVKFKPDQSHPLTVESDMEHLESLIDEMLPNTNIFCAVRVDGHFARVKTRSVPAQKKPYPPLTKVTENQPVFERSDVDGTIVGFRSPAYVKGIGVPGYHLHFISNDRRFGGHLLEFEIDEGDIELDICNRFLMILPEGQSEFDQLDLSADRSQELEKAEK